MLLINTPRTSKGTYHESVQTYQGQLITQGIVYTSLKHPMMHHFVKIKDKYFSKANLQLKLQYQDMSHAMVATIKIYIHVPEGMDNYIPMIQNTHSI